MANYRLSLVLGTSLAFSAGSDVLEVDVASAGDLRIEVSGSDLIFWVGSASVTLRGVSLDNLTTTNVTFTDGSQLLVGDNTTGSANDSLANVLAGTNGNDQLLGLGGDDTMIGGLGDDTYVVDSALDVVTEELNGGTDTILSSVTLTLPLNVERLVLTGTGNINATGNGLDNTLIGNSGNNVLNGKAGNDTMIAGAGDDIYVVNSALDVVTEELDAGTDTIQSPVSLTLPLNVERLTLAGAVDINGTGNALDNTLTGNAGANVLDGGAGNDTLIGGAGNDTVIGGVGVDLITGGIGNDSINGGAGRDVAVYAGAIASYSIVQAGGVVQVGDLAPTINGDDGTDTLQNVEVLRFLDGEVITAEIVNDALVASPVILAPIAEDSGVRTITAAELLAGVSDVDGPAASITALTIAIGNVTLADNNDGTWSYTPALDDDTAVTFDYTASDGALSASSTASLDITPVNDVPVTTDDSAATDEDTQVVDTVADNTTDVDDDVLTELTYSVVGTTATGLSFNADGSFEFDPRGHFDSLDTGGSTTVSFDYRANDGEDDSNVSTATITVTGVNDAPVTTDDSVATNEDTPVAGTVVDNTTDADDDVSTELTYSMVGLPPPGLTFNPNGTFAFDPGGSFDYLGTDEGEEVSFDYRANDGEDNSNVSTATITVTGVNDAPVADPDTLAATEDTPIIYTAADLLDNDTDTDSATLAIASVASGTGGTVALNGNGTVSFTPNANFNGAASFSYVATDGALNSNSATVTVNVAAVNDAPVANPDTLAATENTPITFTAAQLLGNDTDVDTGTVLAIASVASGTDGAVVLNGNGTVSFAPNANFNGAASFSYVATDGALNSNSATVTVNVTAENDAPVANPDTLAATEDTPIIYTAAQLLGNDTDVDTGTVLAIASVASGTGGAVVLNGNGTVSFTPNANFNGAASFSYVATDGALNSNSATVTVNVAAVNDAPIATNDTLANVAEDSATRQISFASLLANDSTGPANEAAQTLTITAVSNVVGGSAVINGTNIDFTPAANFNGTASFDYTVQDNGTTNGAADPRTASASASFAVTAVNDAPVAVNDTLASVAEDSGTRSISFAALTGNDNDGDPEVAQTLTITAVSNPVGGSAVINGTNIDFTPAANFNGTASFDYTVQDNGTTNGAADPRTASASASFAVTAVNDAPVAVNDSLVTTEDTPLITLGSTLTGNDTDVDGNALTVTAVGNATNGAVVLSGGTVTFTPDANFNGTASYEYTVSDGQLTDIGLVTVSVAAVNNAPQAVDDTLSAIEDAPLITLAVTLTGNDTDVDGNALTVTAVGNATNGAVVLSGGTVTFTPDANFNGTASYEYTVSDGQLTDIGLVTVNVAAVNDAPIATNDTLANVAEDSATRQISFASLLANDSTGPANEAAQTLTITAVSNVVGGSAVINGTNIDFTPAANFNGTASFDYTVQDNGTTNGAADPRTASASASFAVTAVNDAPVAVNDSLVTTEDTPLITLGSTLTGNDTDVDGNALTVTAVGNATNGAVVLSGGTVTFTPDANFNGTASYEYTVSDGQLTDIGLVTVSVAAVNNAPQAVDDTLSAIEDAPLITLAVTLTGNDTDVDGNALTVTAVGNATNGAVVLSGGTVTFTPDANFNGTASYEYTVSDGQLTDIGLVTVNVAAVNDAPIATNDTLANVAEDSATRQISFASLLANDSTGPANEAAQTLTITAVSNVVGGSAVINGTNIDFTPAANFNGTASFDYTVQDNGTTNGAADPRTASASASFAVTAVNDAPVAVNDTLASVAEDSGTRSISFAALTGNDNDGDPEVAQTLTITAVSNPVGGSAVINGTNIDFTPAANFNGTASFDYTVQDNGTTNGAADPRTASASASFAVTAVNDAPVAVNDSLVTTEDTPIIYTAAQLLGNDTDVDTGTVLAIASVASGTGGAVVLNGNGTVSFAPNANFNGAASFSYVATDGALNSNSATVTVNVAAVNDAPVANPDTLAATEDTPVTYTAAQLLGNDTDVDTGTVLAIASVASGTGGAVVLNGNGTVSFTPNANFNGAASFSYVASDGALNSNSATVTVNVTEVNDAPDAVNDGPVSTAEDTLLANINVLGNDSRGPANEAAQTLTVIAASAINGTVTINGNGTLNYTPNANYNGADTISYTVQDNGTGNGAPDAKTDSATVAVSVSEVNDAPVAVNDTLASVAEDSGTRSISFAALTGNDNDGDPEVAQTLTITAVSNPVGGSAVINGTNIDFTPAANFNGTASFDYTVQDNGTTNGAADPRTASASASFAVTAVNDAPVAVNDTLASVAEDSGTRSISFAALTGNDNDGDPEVVQTLTITAVSNPVGGSVAIVGGQVEFTPAANFNGTASFDYTVQDNGTTNGAADPRTASATASFAVIAADNAAPVANPDTLAATEDTPVTYTAAQLLGNDTDVDTGTVLAIASVTSGTGGAVVLNGNGTVSFTPNANFNGAASFSYVASDGALNSNSATVTVNVAAVNDAPVANPDTLAATEDTPIIYTAAQLLGNDTDVDTGTVLAIASVASGTGGAVVLNGNGTVSFTPNANFNGAASFSYVATDGALNSNSATVTVNVAAVNDAPVANPDTLAATEDTPIIYTAAQLLGNDTDVDTGTVLAIASVTSGTGGAVVLNGNGTVSFTPNANFNGAASFSYVASDGALNSNSATVTVNVTAENDAPVANPDTLTATEDTPIIYTAAQLLGNDTDVDTGTVLAIASVASGTGGAVVLNGNGTVSFTPNANFNGAASFSYVASDGALNSNSATVTVNVAAVNDAPVANPDTLAATEDTPVTYTAAQLLGNDTDVDTGTVLAIASVASGTGGAVVLNGNGTVSFTPNANFNGAASFSYVASDGALNSNSATVTVNVAAVNNNAPVAVADTASATEDGAPVTINVLANDTDADPGDTKTVVSVNSDLLQGTTVQVAAGGSGVIYSISNAFQFLGAGETEIETFSYTMADAAGAQSTADVTVVVTGVNDAPVAVQDFRILSEDSGPITLDVLLNDTDPDGDPFGNDTKIVVAIDTATTGTLGSVTIADDGSAVIYTVGSAFQALNQGETATDIFSYTMEDSAHVQSTTTVTVTVVGANEPPPPGSIIGSAFNDTINTTNAADTIFGLDGDDTINSAGGADTIFGGPGRDILDAGAGNDVLVGNIDRDEMTGGTGADIFQFERVSDSTAADPDRIFDFSSAEGDKLDLHLIDANTTVAGNQAFTLSAAFTLVAGELVLAAGSVLGDVNGDGVADFGVDIRNGATLGAGDILL